MNILANENISPIIVERLRQEGHQVRSIFEISRGSVDSNIIDMANQQGELLLTDDKDFGELVIYEQRASFGVILLRLEGVSMLQRAEMLISFIQENGEKLLHSFSVIKVNKSRIIRILPRRRHLEID